MRLVRRLRRTRVFAALAGNRKGATAVEYGLVVALIVIAVMMALIGLGGQTQSAWDNIHQKVKAANGG